jgi:glutaconate CoA-transferase, subunit B
MQITSDELMAVCMSHQITDGELVVQGLATPLVAAAFLLARHTHAPHLYFASAIGQGVCRQPAPLGLARIESLWLDRSLTTSNFVRVAADILPRLHPKEFFRPAQVDACGNFNNLAFGKDHRKPRLRLPGSGGIPDVTVVSERVYMYVPRHSRVIFVPQLDFLSGLGYSPARTHGHGPQYLVSDLGQFDFANGRMRLVTYHPWTSPEQVQAHTGFELEIAPGICQTPEPSMEEIRLLRELIDPLGIRRLESLGGAERRKLIHDVLKHEEITAEE